MELSNDIEYFHAAKKCHNKAGGTDLFFLRTRLLTFFACILLPKVLIYVFIIPPSIYTHYETYLEFADK